MKIRQGVIIGAGAVVAKDIPPYAVAIGTHDKVVKTSIFFEDLMRKNDKDVLLYDQGYECVC